MPCSADLWNEFCEDEDCPDTRFHASTEELLERIRRASIERNETP